MVSFCIMEARVGELLLLLRSVCVCASSTSASCMNDGFVMMMKE